MSMLLATKTPLWIPAKVCLNGALVTAYTCHSTSLWKLPSERLLLWLSLWSHIDTLIAIQMSWGSHALTQAQSSLQHPCTYCTSYPLIIVPHSYHKGALSPRTPAGLAASAAEKRLMEERLKTLEQQNAKLRADLSRANAAAAAAQVVMQYLLILSDRHCWCLIPQTWLWMARVTVCLWGPLVWHYAFHYTPWSTCVPQNTKVPALRSPHSLFSKNLWRTVYEMQCAHL